MQHEQRAKLTYLAGSLFGKAQELRKLLHEMEQAGQEPEEIHLSYQKVDGEAVRLILHIDKTEFTMMVDEEESDFRLDVSDSSLHIE
jgi:hypothetical protein